MSIHVRAMLSLVAAVGLAVTPLSAHTSAAAGTSVKVGQDASAVQQQAPKAVVVGWNSPSMDASGRLSVVGQLKKSDGTYVPAGSKVWVQRSRTGTGGWVNVDRVTTTDSGWYNSVFDGKVLIDHPTGYFQLRYYGDAGALPGVSKKFKSPRTQTRFIKFNASPEPVTKGKTITVTGIAQRGGRCWTSIGNHQRVQVYLVGDYEDALPVLVGTTRTNARGAFSFKTKAVRDGLWFATWTTPSKWYLNAVSKFDAVDVR